MDRQVLTRKIMRIGDEIRRLEQDLTALQSVDLVAYPDNYNSLSQQIASNGEFISRKLRELIYSTTNSSWPEIMEHAADALDIDVACGTNGLVEITFPCLIPKRTKKPTDFITAPLAAVLERFVSELEPPLERFKHCVICITHVYDETLYCNARKRDHDNIELKGIIDVINSFLLIDDSGNLCDIYQTSEFADVDHTRISIVKKDMFLEWIMDTKFTRKAYPKITEF